MFFRKNKNNLEIMSGHVCTQVIYEEEYDLDLTVEELHAYNCLVYYVEKEIPESAHRLSELSSANFEIRVLQAHYAAWLIESNFYTGIEKAVADSLLEKLKTIF